MRVVLPLCVVALVGCTGGASKDEAPAKSDAVNLRPGPDAIRRTRESVQKANEAGAKRTDDAVDRATKAEAVERGAPERR